MKKELTELKRVIVYIDGFNLYFGLREKYPYLKWLNVMELSKKLLKENQILECVKYFTARINNDPTKEKRQNSYIEVLENEGVDIIFGRYQNNTIKCKRCGTKWSSPNEKMTDVNIATSMLFDASSDSFDIAILISGDSDLTPPLNIIKQKYPEKAVIVAFPPYRHNNTIANAAKASFTLGRANLASSQFADEIKLKSGFTIIKPKEWSKTI